MPQARGGLRSFKLTMTGSGKHVQAMNMQDSEGCQRGLVGCAL